MDNHEAVQICDLEKNSGALPKVEPKIARKQQSAKGRKK